ncbi:hypothetical protein ES702_06894 [subsurface metagenome]
MGREDSSLVIVRARRTRGNLTRLHHSPKGGRIIPELQEYRIYQYRELIVAPWRLMYRAQEDKVYVLAVLDSRQNIEDILLKRILDVKL